MVIKNEIDMIGKIINNNVILSMRYNYNIE